MNFINEKFLIEAYNNDDENVLKFQTTFHFSDPLQKEGKLALDQIDFLKKELQYDQQVISELKQQRAKDEKKDCKSYGLPNCQVSIINSSLNFIPFICTLFYQ